MKYVVIIADGAADQPIDALGGLTPFQAAKTPVLDNLAQTARIGAAFTTPEGFTAGSDVCSMSLLGYDPRQYHTGRAPLEAAALGLNLAPHDWIFRLNFVTVGEDSTPDAGLMLDHSAGAISSAEARILAAALMEFWRSKAPDLLQDFSLTPGVSYRNILIDSCAARGSSRSYSNVITTPPHEIPREPWLEHMPAIKSNSDEPALAGADALCHLIELSRDFLPTHPINLDRIKAGKRPANMAWIWGQGSRPSMPSFADRFGLKGAMITAVDLLAGIAALMGWDRLDVPGITSYHDTNYAGQGQAVCDSIDDYDIICCHVEAPDEASHQGDHITKVAAIESIDRFVLAPILKKLQTFGDPQTDRASPGWRLLYLPDHYTLVSTRKHDPTPVPFLMAGAYIRAAVERTYDEPSSLKSDLIIDPGHDLMEYFLRGGLVRPSSRT